MALLFFLSGFTGLVYQVLWVRRFTHVMGSGSVSVSVVIAAFMGGLFLGAVLLMRVLRHCRHELARRRAVLLLHLQEWLIHHFYLAAVIPLQLRIAFQ